MANYDPDRVEKPQNTPMMPPGDSSQPIPKDYDYQLADGVDTDRLEETYERIMQERANQRNQLAVEPESGE